VSSILLVGLPGANGSPIHVHPNRTAAHRTGGERVSASRDKKQQGKDKEAMRENEGASTQSEFWVLSKVVDTTSDPDWDTALVIVGTPDSIRSQFDLSRGLPTGWKLLRGKAARRFLEAGANEELHWRREQRTRQAAGGAN
jgi:hypothetical protein